MRSINNQINPTSKVHFSKLLVRLKLLKSISIFCDNLGTRFTPVRRKGYGNFSYVCLKFNSPLDIKEIEVCDNIRKGDKNAFETVFKSYYRILCSYANQIIADSDNSEEIVQEIFFQLWQKKEFLFIETSLKSYLFRAVHNSCINFIKHNKIKKAYSSNYLHQNETSGSQYNLDESDELKDLIGKAVEQLPPERKKVFMMIRYEDRKYQEVADILGISVKTVENQMGKAMQFLRETLKGYIPVFIILILLVLQSIFKIK